MTTTKQKQKLWFDPKNPPKTPIYVGQRIPIYIVPDDTEEDDRLVEPSWEKTDWVFRVVGIRRTTIEDEDGNKKEGDVVDVEWPNGHIDTDIPISNMYGHFARLPKSMVSRFTEEYHSSDEEVEIIDLSKAQTNQEKLEQLLKMLQFLSEQREYIRSEGSIEDDKPSITVEETVENPTKIDDNSPAPKVLINEGTPDLDNEKLQRVFPDLSPSAIEALRAAARQADLKQAAAESTQEAKETSDDDQKDNAQPLVKKPVSKKATTKARKPSKQSKEPASKITKSMIAKWFRPPSKGGLRIAELRDNARKAGIENPQKLKKEELQEAMTKLAV